MEQLTIEDEYLSENALNLNFTFGTNFFDSIMLPAFVNDLVTIIVVVLSEIGTIFIQLILWGLIWLFIKYSAMAWFRGEHFFREPTNGNPRIGQMKMIKVHVPFTFKLQDSPDTSSREIRCKISSHKSYSLYAFWGVSIEELHLFLRRPWINMLSEINEGNILEGFCRHSGTHFRSELHADKEFKLQLPNEELDFGTPPRLIYPLVVFIISDETEDISQDETVALITIVHVKDVVCTLPTSILAQYLKQASGQLSSLKQLYVADGNSSNYDSNMDILEDTEQLCVVCQHFPVSRALLPCRHTCICASCFEKIDICPICRSSIGSYFCIRNEEYLTQSEGSNSSLISPFQYFNNWFNNQLGLNQL